MNCVVLVAALVLPAGSERDAAAALSQLFPGAQVTGDPSQEGSVLVAPVYRDGKVGFAGEIKYAVSGGVRWLAFELELVPTPKDEKIVAPARAVEFARKFERYHRVAAVIALDARGKVLGKPKGWPLESTHDRSCMGDLCHLSFVTVRELTTVGREPVVLVEYLAKGFHNFLGLAANAKGVASSQIVKGDLIDDLSACRYTRTVKPRVFGCKLSLAIEDRCEWKECQEDCQSEGMTGPRRTDALVLLNGVCAPKP